MTLDTVHFILDIMVGAGVIAIGIPYLRSQYRKGSDQAQDESNKILRGLVDDQQKSIKALNEWKTEAEKTIAFLTERVNELSTKKTDLEKLIAAALHNYFEQHPEVAHDIDGKFNADGTAVTQN